MLNYYSENDVDFSFEQKLNRIESNVSPVVKELAINPNIELSDLDKENLFNFIKMSYVRSPRGRKLIREVGAVLKHGGFVEVMDLPSEKPYIVHRDSFEKHMSKTFDFGEFDPSDEIDPNVKAVHSAAFERVMKTMPLLYQEFDFDVFSTENDKLITSDSAAILFSSSMVPTGLAGAEQIYLPISSKVGLMCFRRNSKGARSITDLPFNFVDFLNKIVKSNTRKFLISHPSFRSEIENFKISPDVSELSVDGL